MQTRIAHISRDFDDKHIIAGSNRGILYRLNLDLAVVQFSSKMAHSSSLHVIVTDENYVFARDTAGNICRWDRKSFAPLDFLLSENFTDIAVDETSKAPMPVQSHALALWKDKLLTVNAWGQLVTFDKKTLRLESAIDVNPNAYAESIDVTVDGSHLISDCAGDVWIGDTNKESFKHLLNVNHGNVHCVRYDSLHDRYWATTDTFGGFWIFRSSGEVLHQIKMTIDDVEWMDFNEDQSMAFMACFDHHLYIYSNLNSIPELIKKVGPFKFQLKQVLVIDNSNIFVLLESGEIYKYNLETDQISNPIFGTNAIWGIDWDKDEQHILFCPMENGKISQITYGVEASGRYFLDVLKTTKDIGFGRVRRSIPLGDKSIVGISTSGNIFRLSSNDEILWSVKSNGICRDIDVSLDKKKCIVCDEKGVVTEIEIESGKILYQEQFRAPLFTLCYDHKGAILLGERALSRTDEHGNYDAISQVIILNERTHKVIKTIQMRGNSKRMRRLPDGNVLLNGNGNINLSVVDTDNYEIAKQFDDWILNTPENAILVNNHVYAVTYSLQLNTYNYESQEIVDSQFTIEDYPKGLAAMETESGKSLLVVAGRGYASLYDVTKVTPNLVKTIYI